MLLKWLRTVFSLTRSVRAISFTNIPRTINVINQPIKGGGWLATHEDITERRKAERELEQTRAFLHTVIENVPSPIIVKGAQDLHYMLVNRAAERYLGLDRETLLGKRAIEVIPFEGRDIDELLAAEAAGQL